MTQAPIRQTNATHADSVAALSRRVRMIALDLDGTLIRSDGKVSVVNAQAIGRARQQGIRVVLASARPPRSVNPLGEQLAADPMQVHYNGALIHDRQARTHVFHQPLDSALATRLVAAARRIEPKVVVSVEILDRWYTDQVDDQFPTQTSKHFSPDFVGPLEAFMHKPVTKLMLAAEPEQLGRVKAVLEQKFAEHIKLVVSDAYLLQIAHREVDKAVAMARVARHYGIDQHEVLAVGDAPNDSMMLRWAGCGVAVGNAWESTRQAADVIGPSNDDDGVAWAIKKFAISG